MTRGFRGSIVQRIYEWARIQPAKTAMACNGVRISYSSFARNIEMQQRFFAQFELQKAARHLPQSARYQFAAVREFPRTEGAMNKVKRSALRKMIATKAVT